MVYKTPLEMLYQWESTAPEKVYLRQPINDQWKTWTWKQTADEVRRMAAALKAMNLPDGSKIGLVSKNCAHWMICDLAIMMSGNVSVPLYPNLNATTLRQILEHSETKLLFVGKLDDWSSMKPGVPQGLKCISFPFYEHREYEQWNDIIAKQQPIKENLIHKPDELATIIYTSGTTGMPKGVMHTFYNFSFALSNAAPVLGLSTASKFFSYLPLSHIAERLLVEVGSIYSGGEVAFAESLEKFPKNLAEAKPTVFLGVPRIWTKFQQGILAKLPQKKLNTFMKIPILSGLVKKKIKKGLGLTEATNVLTGAAPTPVSLINWFKSVGINIQEAYAMTENCCYSHLTVRNNIKIGFVGQPLPLCEVKLGENKEILIKHAALMTGYYKEPQLTKESFTADGFLKTGDEGFIDKEGFLKITGRVKDIFKTTKGKYVAPSPIEMKISGNRYVEQVCVVGSGLAQPIAIVTLSETSKRKSEEEIISSLEDSLKNINITLDIHEQLEKLVLLRGEWTVENEMLTPTLKIKRSLVEKKYSNLYEKWSKMKGLVVWEN